ncbi:MAG: protein kinase [Nannocystaceae bacterium]
MAFESQDPAGDPARSAAGLPLLSTIPAPPMETLDVDGALGMALMRARLFGGAASSGAPGESLQVGRFTVLDRVGEGGMGVVYAAYDELLDRKVALKLLHLGGLAGDGEARLLREAQAMARLSHPNIVAIYEVGSHGAQRFIAMEFVRGQSLDAWLRAASRGWREVLPVLLAAGRGLEAAHRAGLVHRDYKPANTLVGVDGSVKVADFGLARSSVGGEGRPGGGGEAGGVRLHDALTVAGAIVGTPAYMAPEQAAGRPCDAASDQFSFCVTAYHALYGELPFEAATFEALIVAIDAGRVREAPADSTVPTWVRRAILRGLAADPAHRHPSMGALLDALARDPARVRRRRLGLGLFGASLGLLGALGGVALSSVDPPCPDGAVELQGAWDEERRQAIAAAIEGSGLPFARASFAHLEADLDRYAGAWSAMLTGACEDHRAGRRSDTHYDLQVRCLEQRRAELASLTDVLRDGDAEALPRAALAVDGLAPVASCGDLEALLADPLRPPDDPTTAPAVARVQAGLARVRALESTGLYARALAAAGALAADVEASRHRPFAAELALLRGRALLRDRPDAADDALTEALHVGLRSGHDRVAVEALARRIFVRGYSLGRSDDALRDESLILDLLERIDDDGRLRGEYLNNMGAVWLGRGAWTRAEALFVAALAAKTAAYGEGAGELVYTYANLGTLRSDLSRSGAAIEALEEAREVGARAFGATHPVVLLVQADLGRAYLQHLRFHDAEATLTAARQGAEGRGEAVAEGRDEAGAGGRDEAVAEGRGDAGAEGRGNAGAEGRGKAGAEGRDEAVAEGRDEADAEVRAAAEVRAEPDVGALAFIEGQLGWLEIERRRPAAAEGHLLRAEALLEAQGGDPAARSNNEVLLAHCAALRGDEAGALERLERARAALTGLPPDHPRWLELDGDVADLALSLGRPDEALARAEETLEGVVAGDERSARIVARAREHQALALRALGRSEAAIAAAEALLAALAEVVDEENPRIAGALALLAGAEIDAGRRDLGEAHLERAESIYVRCSDPDVPHLARVRFERARLLEGTDPARAGSLARAALGPLRAAGDGFLREREAVEAWLAARDDGKIREIDN